MKITLPTPYYDKYFYIGMLRAARVSISLEHTLDRGSSVAWVGTMNYLLTDAKSGLYLSDKL